MGDQTLGNGLSEKKYTPMPTSWCHIQNKEAGLLRNHENKLSHFSNKKKAADDFQNRYLRRICFSK